MTTTAKVGVLFVCHANMCRSPLAHGMFVHRATARGVLERLDVDSAGTWAAEGIPPHHGSLTVASEHDLDLGPAGTSRGLRPDDLQRFAHIIVMDRANATDVERLQRLSAFGTATGGQARVRLLQHLVDPKARGSASDVPDPVRGGPQEFRGVYDLVLAGCDALLDELFGRLPG